MKKVLFAFLLVAVLGGHQFIVRNEDSKILPQSFSVNMQADLLLENERCKAFWANIKAQSAQNEDISLLFYSPKIGSCIYEKRIKSSEGGITQVELIDMDSERVLESWTSGTSFEYKTYFESVKEYQ